ncbi:MAG: beta-ketoacyl synthase N-terminal-like domain-containing protein, partial [Actinocatenispora sp.]
MVGQQEPGTSGGAGDAGVRPETDQLVRRLTSLSTMEQDRLLLDLARTEVARVTDRPGPSSIQPDLAFRKLGVYREIAAEFRARLAAATGLRVPATLLFDYPTPQAVVAFLRTGLLGAAEPDAVTGPGAGRADEPIAIVGMACRYPGGVQSPDDLWQLVASGTDAISGLPTNRGWDVDALYDPDPDHFGTCCTREGGFLHEAADFDAEFFGISPREALGMDPQQRLLMEVSWEALERAGVDPTTMRGAPAAVYVGVPYTDYGPPLYAPPEGMQGHLLTGNLSSVASGRISYALGLEGPAVTMDTACSSSLVTLHLACQSLRHNECTLALAGGVTVMSSPGVLMEFSRKRGLSGDGRCRSFSTDAGGTGWGEGAGILVLERLSDARRNGHHILAVIRGSAMNQDGASNGLTAPNGPSQQRVIRQALANAGLTPGDVGAVEAHGTGTPLGDPIEAQALLATYGQDRPNGTLWLGSLKSNIGHTQAASGVGGVIKMVEAMRHEQLPRTLHVAEPSAHVDWSAGDITLLTEQVAWPAGGPTRRAGVSSFGVSGTNVHLIVEEAPADGAAETPATTPDAPATVPWVLSGRTADALRAQAGRLRTHLDGHPELAPATVGHSLVTTRSAFERRAVVIGADRSGLLDGVAAVAAGDVRGGVVEGVAQHLGRTAFVFPGQGSQWVGMAVGLMDSAPAFAHRIEECAAALDEYVDWSLLDVLRGVDGAPDLDRVDVVQPVLWAVMVALAELWRSTGVRPEAVVGHSQGEIAAACVAGALTLDEGARVVVTRSRLLKAIYG